MFKSSNGSTHLERAIDTTLSSHLLPSASMRLIGNTWAQIILLPQSAKRTTYRDQSICLLLWRVEESMGSTQLYWVSKYKLHSQPRLRQNRKTVKVKGIWKGEGALTLKSWIENQKQISSWAQWHLPGIPVLQKQRLAGVSLWVQGQPDLGEFQGHPQLLKETLSQKPK